MQEQIIDYLKKSENYISGEEISQSLKMSRAAIWKYIQELRHLGYDIVAVPHLGYKLVGCPDKFFPSEIQYELGTKILGKKIIYKETVPSTMDAAFQLALEGSPEGTVVCAEHQTKGRGRLGRTWTSPKAKGIYVSLILRPQLPPSEVARLTLLCAVAVSEAVKTASGIQPLIKWPNDLLVNDKKLAGILTELSAETDRIKFVIVGIGLNVNASLNHLPAQSTSLKQELGFSLCRVELFQEILREIEEWYVRLDKEGFEPVLSRWKELSSTLNQRVRVVDPAGGIEGEAIDIDQDGGLLIRQDSGVVIKRMAGDVLHRE